MAANSREAMLRALMQARGGMAAPGVGMIAPGGGGFMSPTLSTPPSSAAPLGQGATPAMMSQIKGGVLNQPPTGDLQARIAQRTTNRGRSKEQVLALINQILMKRQRMGMFNKPNPQPSTSYVQNPQMAQQGGIGMTDYGMPGDVTNPIYTGMGPTNTWPVGIKPNPNLFYA